MEINWFAVGVLAAIFIACLIYNQIGINSGSDDGMPKEQ